MTVGPSILSFAASGLYGLVAVACLGAAIIAMRFRQVTRHSLTWLLIALLFGVLIVLRLVDAEEWLRSTLRASMRESGSYADRRAVQAPLVAAILLVAGTFTLALLYRLTRNLKGRRNVAMLVAVLATLAITFLIVLRMASLHAIDSLLFGPIKLNWVIDIGASLAVMVAAVTYMNLVRRSP